MLVVVVAEGVAIALLTVLVLGLLRSHALILRALNELGAGLELEKADGNAAHAAAAGPQPVELQAGVVPASRPATERGSAVTGTTLTGEEVTIPVEGGGRRTLIAFLSSGCSVCQTFWDELSRGEPDVPGDGRLVVVTKGAEEESTTRLRALAGERLEVVQSSATWTDYDVPGSPYFVYVEDGVITGEGSSTTWPQVRDLMSQAVDDAADAARRVPVAGAVSLPPGVNGPFPMDDDVDVAHADSALLGAGIQPGHPSLYDDPGPPQSGSRP